VARVTVAEVVTATSALVALGTVAALLAVALAAVVVRSRRRERGTERRVWALVSDLNARMKRMMGELFEALERAQEEGRRNRLLDGLGGSIDLDEVLSRTLEAAGTTPGADAALVSIGGDEPIVTSAGLSTEEAERQVISGPPDGREARAISMAYQYPPTLEAEGLVHSGLAVPVPGASGAIGFVAVYSRAPAHRFDEAQIRRLEELVQRAGPAIENARRFREARQLADLDALTGLHNRRYFHETLDREVARAQRYGRRLALLVLDVDDFKAINDRIGHLSGDGVLAEAAGRVRDVVRTADIACRVGGDEFAVVLPESAAADAEQLYRRVQGAVSARAIGQAGRLSLTAGIAELLPEDDPTSFFERADDALYRAKGMGKAQVVEAGASSLAPAPEASPQPGTARSR
jgi:diguanylate cyclase (GGDEF)-like protein